MMCRASRIRTKRLEAEDNPKKALKLEDKLEEDQGYASILLAARAKKQPRKPKDALKGLRVRIRIAWRGKKSKYKRRPRKAPGPRKWSTGSYRLRL
jgi:hypothetical protein